MESYFYVDRRLLEPRKKKRSFTKLILSLLLISSGVLILTFFIFPRTNKTVSEITPTITTPPTAAPQIEVAGKNISLEASVQQALAGSHGTYGVVIKNIKTGEMYEFNPDKKFETASLYKLWVMEETYNQIAEGKLTKSQILSQDIPTLNKKFRIASDAAELKEGRVSRSIEDALFRMITYSDNYSALLLTERIRLSSLSNSLKENEFNNSNVGTSNGDPITTASDIALFFEKLYKGELADSSTTNEMIDLLKKQTLNGKIPRYLPKSTVIAHKTGELGGISHDAGIIYSKKGDYIIVVMSDSNSKTGADERIANISKNVYDYFEKDE